MRGMPRLSPSDPFAKATFATVPLNGSRDSNDQGGGNVLLDGLESVADTLDDLSEGWATTYADLSPESSVTPLGVSFLVTNLAYSWVGYELLQASTVSGGGSGGGGAFLGGITEAASAASFAYHYSQLESTGPKDLVVRLALVVDYFFAWTAIVVALSFFVTTPDMSVPVEGLAACSISLVFFWLGTVYDSTRPYIVFHGLWHVLGAYGGYSVGLAHIDALGQTI